MNAAGYGRERHPLRPGRRGGNLRRTFATTGRVLQQLRHDPRSIALMLVAPSLLVGLFAWLFVDQEGVFDRFGGAILALFPFIVMFLVTSITTLRERRSGTLERLMTTPLGKADFIFGYALAFGLLASAFATTEFQAVQFLPLLVFPQVILGGLFMPRDEMPDVLYAISDWLPLSHAVDAIQAVAAGDGGWDVATPMLIVAAFAAGFLVFAPLTLRRRTP